MVVTMVSVIVVYADAVGAAVTIPLGASPVLVTAPGPVILLVAKMVSV